MLTTLFTKRGKSPVNIELRIALIRFEERSRDPEGCTAETRNSLKWIKKFLHKTYTKGASLESRGNLIFPAQALSWTSRNGANSLLIKRNKLAEREGFEPPVRFPVHLISSQAPSTARPPLPNSGLALTRAQAGKKIRQKRARFVRQYATNYWELMIQAPILT